MATYGVRLCPLQGLNMVDLLWVNILLSCEKHYSNCSERQVIQHEGCFFNLLDETKTKSFPKSISKTQMKTIPVELQRKRHTALQTKFLYERLHKCDP